MEINYNQLAKLMLSLPGLAVWMFLLNVFLSVFIFRWRLESALFFSSLMSIFLAFQTSRQLEGSFLMKKVHEGQFTMVRRFTRYLQNDQLPPDASEYPDFMEYLEDTKKSFKKRSVNQEKLVIAILVLVGLVYLVEGTLLGRILVLSMVFVYFSLFKSRAQSRKNIDGLTEYCKAKSGQQR